MNARQRRKAARGIEVGVSRFGTYWVVSVFIPGRPGRNGFGNTVSQAANDVVYQWAVPSFLRREILRRVQTETSEAT